MVQDDITEEYNQSCQFRLLILVVSCWIEAPWLPPVISILEDVPYQCHIVKDLIIDDSFGWVLKGLQFLNLTLWLLIDVCCADRCSLPQSVRQWQGWLKHLQQTFTSNAGKNWLVGVVKKMYQTMPSLTIN